MSFINTETFEPYADVIAADCPENFSYIHDLLAEPVAKLEKKGYAWLKSMSLYPSSPFTRKNSAAASSPKIPLPFQNTATR